MNSVMYMNLRAATLFFWALLMATATVEGNCKDFGKDGSAASRAEQVHGEHEVITRRAIETTTD